MRDAPQLITYADRLGGDLDGLRSLLDGPLAGAFGGVHVLPFFTPIDGADAGFDPDDHTEVDERVGDWDDVARLAQGRDLMADLIVNHVSTRAPQFRDWLEHGADSEHARMFLTFSGVFPDGATEDELLTIYRPRPGLPFTPITFADGSRRLAWTTFTSEQVDVDVGAEQTRAYLRRILDRFTAAGVTDVRLDAVGYAVKTPGTSSFLTDATHDFMNELSSWCHERGLEVLVEVHSYWEDQVALASRVDRTYDFALPPLVLHGLTTGDAAPLHRWLTIRPSNVVTVLDTHDGIGVRDVARDPADHSRAGLLDEQQVDDLVETIHTNSHDASRRATGSSASNVDLYQVNCTWVDALGGDDLLALTSRLLQVLVPGIPQVYYVGMLHGHNDVDLLTRTGVGRDINRHRYTEEELAGALGAPAVRRLLALLRWRGAHPAFGGEFVLGDEDPHVISLSWQADEGQVECAIDLRDGGFDLVVDGETVKDLLDLAPS